MSETSTAAKPSPRRSSLTRTTNKTTIQPTQFSPRTELFGCWDCLMAKRCLPAETLYLQIGLAGSIHLEVSAIFFVAVLTKARKSQFALPFSYEKRNFQPESYELT
ncbi:hypothetical protein JTE90_025189 [Oedothorax gibbosus]|uniref:Uncharacterized protein n=1 Tax=Oedothorax gibbosus TaxID=931172 RepID=A0AAV6UCU1_9ARAC|nr:hypothetical protein JTE90_025189 [Oedothorax gibbosus]